jgi:hypothetical protein
MRTLLSEVRGVVSFESLYWYEGVRYPTYKAACIARGLELDDHEADLTMQEGARVRMPKQLRQLFATVLIYNTPTDPNALWQKYKAQLSEDFVNPNRGSGVMTTEVAEQTAFWLIVKICQQQNSDINIQQLLGVQYDPLPYDLNSYSSSEKPSKKNEQRDFQEMQKSLHDDQKAAFTAIKEAIDDPQKLPRFFFLNGAGGTGKTHLYRLIIKYILLQGKRYIACAASGIAASIIPDATTMHYAFGLPPCDHPDDRWRSTLNAESQRARELQAADIVLIDEVSMIPRQALDAIDTILRHLGNPDVPFGGKVVVVGGDFRQLLPVIPDVSAEEQKLFCSIYSGLWRNVKRLILLSNKRVKSGEKSLFLHMLDKIGDGTMRTDNNGQFPVNPKIITTDSLIEFVYARSTFTTPSLPASLLPAAAPAAAGAAASSAAAAGAAAGPVSSSSPSPATGKHYITVCIYIYLHVHLHPFFWYCTHTYTHTHTPTSPTRTYTLTNSHFHIYMHPQPHSFPFFIPCRSDGPYSHLLSPHFAEQLNHRIILTTTNIQADRLNQAILDLIPSVPTHTLLSTDRYVCGSSSEVQLPPDILNDIEDNGFPSHSIKVKEGCIILLMRNMDVAGGLCNGTRLRIDHIGTRVLRCTILSGIHRGQVALIPKMKLLYNRKGIPFTRFQFPIKLCYAMTIHKAQGQTFDRVGIDFTGTIFTHGLVYVGMSRCSSMENLRLFLTAEQQEQYLLRNIVFTDLLEYAANPLLLPDETVPSSPPPSPSTSPLPEYRNVSPPLEDNDNDIDLQSEEDSDNDNQHPLSSPSPSTSHQMDTEEENPPSSSSNSLPPPPTLSHPPSTSSSSSFSSSSSSSANSLSSSFFPSFSFPPSPFPLPEETLTPADLAFLTNYKHSGGNYLEALTKMEDEGKTLTRIVWNSL